METTKKSGSISNNSSAKMLNIIEYLAEQKEPVRLLDISKGLNINSSTALRFITTLVNHGYASQEEDSSKYYLTYKLCKIANKINLHLDMRDIIRPYMKKISDEFGELVCLAIEQRMKVVYIETFHRNDKAMHMMQMIGNIAPMHCTGIGKQLMLNYTEDDIDKLIETQGLPRLTEYTICDKPSLMEELKKVREQGYSFDNEECEIGIRCIAFPIYGMDNKVIAGLSISGPSNRMNDDFLFSKLDYCRDIVREIAIKMGAE